ncbi:hypothetical protein GQ600_5122 [Phytophthora cactorum]|nr:hypothetical protein GQ600_5122 [Phytophthora cactorum]
MSAFVGGGSVDGKSFAEKFAVRWWQHNLRSYKKMAGLLGKMNIDTRASDRGLGGVDEQAFRRGQKKDSAAFSDARPIHPVAH